MLNFGFTWRGSQVESAYANLDTFTYHSPGHSLLVGFASKRNLECGQVFQYIKVKQSTSYRFPAYIITYEITTDSGRRLEVRDACNPGALDQLTPNLIGTPNGWCPLLLDFKTDPKTEFLVLRLAWHPSQKIDNLIKGKVWLDDNRLTPLGE